jgi:spermidine synthase
MHSFLTVAILLLGFSSIITQTVLLREFLSVFSGNELIIGIVLAVWMTLTGTGAYLARYARGRFSGSNWIIIVLSIVAVMPIVILSLLQLFRSIAFPIGSLIGLPESLYSSIVLLAPYCLPSGFLFALLSREVSEEFHSNLISRVYAIEGGGAVVGGLIVNLVAVHYLTTFEILVGLSGMSLMATFLLALARWRRLWLVVFAGIFSVAAVLLFAFGIEDATRRFMYKGQDVLYRSDTPFGTLTVTRLEDQVNFFENGVLLCSSGDVTASEEAVHFALVQRRSPANVLLVSGGLSGATAEILKYKVESLDYVEIDPWLVEAGRRFTNALADPRIRVITEDPRRFIRSTTSTYDAVIINTSDPATAQLNRYYTVEFLRDLKERLAPGGVVSMGLLPASEYLGEEARKVTGILYATLRSVFANVVVVPGLRNYYLASDSALDIRIATKVAERGIPTLAVNPSYVDDTILEQRSATLVRHMATGEGVNEDFRPLAYYRQLLYWLSYFKFEPQLLLLGLGVVVVVLAYRLAPISFGLFAAGFASSSLEFLLLVSFQALVGYIFQIVGVLITVFMGGLALGAWYAHRRFGVATVRRFVVLQILVALYAILLPWIVTLLRDGNVNPAATQAILLGLTALISALVGMQFALATPLLAGSVIHVASELYGFDLIGAAIGILLVSTFFLPLLGLANACTLIAGLSLAAALITLIRTKGL